MIYWKALYPKMLESIWVDCPYCGAEFATVVDCSGGSQRYIEDCQVCCHPIEFVIEVDIQGKLVKVELLRDDQ